MKIESEEKLCKFVGNIADVNECYGSYVHDSASRVVNYIWHYMPIGQEYFVLGIGFKEFDTEFEAGISFGKNTNAWCCLKVMRAAHSVYITRVW